LRVMERELTHERRTARSDVQRIDGMRSFVGRCRLPNCVT
jgi:hypothetical protein